MSPIIPPPHSLFLFVSLFLPFCPRHSLSIYADVIAGVKIKRAKTLNRASEDNLRGGEGGTDRNSRRIKEGRETELSESERKRKRGRERRIRR